MQRSCLENDWLRVQALSHRFTPSLWAVVFRSQSTSGDLLFIYNSESVACWDTEEPSSWTGSLPLPAPGLIRTSRSQRTWLVCSSLVNKQLCSHTGDSSSVGLTTPACWLVLFLTCFIFFVLLELLCSACVASGVVTAGKPCGFFSALCCLCVSVLVSAFVHPSCLLSFQDHQEQLGLSRICLGVLRCPPVPSRAG